MSAKTKEKLMSMMISVDMLEALKKYGRGNDRTVSSVIRIAIMDFLAKHSTKETKK